MIITRIASYVFILWSFVMGILIITTGALHFVYNESDSFQIKGLLTNPTLAVILVAVSLLVMGALTFLLPIYYIVFRKNKTKRMLHIFTMWYFILCLLTFFMTGILGFSVAILCFVTSVILAVCVILVKFPKKNDPNKPNKLEENDETEGNDEHNDKQNTVELQPEKTFSKDNSIN